MTPRPKSPRRRDYQGEPTFNEPRMSTPDEDDAGLFYQHLEQAGQLIDVDDNTDLASLSSRVTHVRRPDGSVERIGFSAY